jgi:hypothetical protein
MPEQGEQLELIDITPENMKEILPVARRYQKHKDARMKALDKEVKAKQELLTLIKAANLAPLDDKGTIRFKCDDFIIIAKPKEWSLKVKEGDE